jgi:hypothetical protein
MAPAPVIPRPGANKDAAVEPIRPVVPVRGAGIRVVSVIAPLADRGTINYGSGNNRRADSNILIVHILILGHRRCCQGHSQQSCQQNQANIFHKTSSCFLVPHASNRGSGDNLCHQHCRLLGFSSHPASNLSNRVSAIKLRYPPKIVSQYTGKAAPPAVPPGKTTFRSQIHFQKNNAPATRRQLLICKHRPVTHLVFLHFIDSRVGLGHGE